MTTLTLFRHSLKSSVRQPDDRLVRLSDEGEARARVAGCRYRSTPFDFIVVSPAVRAIQTCNEFMKEWGIRDLPTLALPELYVDMGNAPDTAKLWETCHRVGGKEPLRSYNKGSDGDLMGAYGHRASEALMPMIQRSGDVIVFGHFPLLPALAHAIILKSENRQDEHLEAVQTVVMTECDSIRMLFEGDVVKAVVFCPFEG